MVAQRQPPAVSLEPSALVYDDPQPIRLPPDWELTDERFLEIGELNPEQIFERTADGRLHQMTWPDGLSESVSTKILAFVTFWAMGTLSRRRGARRAFLWRLFPARQLRARPRCLVGGCGADRGTGRAARAVLPCSAFRRRSGLARSPSQTVPAQQSKMQRLDEQRRAAWLADRSLRGDRLDLSSRRLGRAARSTRGALRRGCLCWAVDRHDASLGSRLGVFVDGFALDLRSGGWHASRR